jgi:hypothetical protein
VPGCGGPLARRLKAEVAWPARAGRSPCARSTWWHGQQRLAGGRGATQLSGGAPPGNGLPVGNSKGARDHR